MAAADYTCCVKCLNVGTNSLCKFFQNSGKCFNPCCQYRHDVQKLCIKYFTKGVGCKQSNCNNSHKAPVCPHPPPAPAKPASAPAPAPAPAPAKPASAPVPAPAPAGEIEFSKSELLMRIDDLNEENEELHNINQQLIARVQVYQSLLLRFLGNEANVAEEFEKAMQAMYDSHMDPVAPVEKSADAAPVEAPVAAPVAKLSPHAKVFEPPKPVAEAPVAEATEPSAPASQPTASWAD